MERLTEELQIGPFAALKDKAEAVPGAFGTYDCFYAHEVAVTKLKQYEDTGLEPRDVTDLMAAYGIAIGTLAEYREEKKAPKCYSPDTERPYSPDTDVGCRYMVCDGDDEPIDRCKRCPLCYVDKQRHQPEPNAPLTLEELREMDGEPVWVRAAAGGWAIVNLESGEVVFNDYFGTSIEALIGQIYRRKPEEGTMWQQ